MTRPREIADQVAATSAVPPRNTESAEAVSSEEECGKRVKCDWGTPERTGEKPDWYRSLFH